MTPTNSFATETALAMCVKAQEEYRKALATWNDLPAYVHTEAYYHAFMAWIWKAIDAGHEDMETLVLYTLDHETGGKQPYFDFPRGK